MKLLKYILSIIYILTINISNAQKADTNDIDIEIGDYEIQYNIKWKRDVPIVVGGTALYLLGNTIQNNVEPLTVDEINSLNRNDVNVFDGIVINNNNSISRKTSDIVLAASAVAPLSLLAFKPVRKEVFPVLVVYLETSITISGLTNITKGLVKRNRPFMYDRTIPIEDKQTSNGRHSFFSGHTSHAAAYSFLTAHFISRYSKKKWVKQVAWGGAFILPATVGYLRMSAGKHFPTDVLTGYVIGAGVGYLMPQLHREELPDKKLSFNAGFNGFYLAYHF